MIEVHRCFIFSADSTFCPLNAVGPIIFSFTHRELYVHIDISYNVNNFCHFTCIDSNIKFMQDAKSMSESIQIEITFSIHGRLFVVIQVKIVRYETEIPNLLRKSEFETHVKKNKS